MITIIDPEMLEPYLTEAGMSLLTAYWLPALSLIVLVFNGYSMLARQGTNAMIGALNTKIDSQIGALNTKIDSQIGALNTKIDFQIGALSSKLDAIVTAMDMRARAVEFAVGLRSREEARRPAAADAPATASKK